MSPQHSPDNPKRGRTREVHAESSTQSLKATDTSLAPGSIPANAPAAPGIPSRFGRYRLLKELGRGAMGVVYLAEDTQLGRQVALKIPRRSALEDPESLERFYREAKMTATLRHNNICQVYDVGAIDGVCFLSMEYVPGKTIDSFLNKSKLPAPRQVALLVRKIALALNEAHSQGVVHRDLKPSNVMLDDRGEPKVMDFGLARQINTANQARITQSGAILGTPAYMAPEQVRGETDRIGPQSDVYALGVMLYQFLTGELPFSGPILAVFARILTEEPKRPSELRPDVDPTLEALCLNMMAKDPAQRLGRMRDVAEILSAYLKNGPSLGLPASGSSKLPTPGTAASPSNSPPIASSSASGQIANSANATGSRMRSAGIAMGAVLFVATLIGIAAAFRGGAPGPAAPFTETAPHESKPETVASAASPTVADAPDSQLVPIDQAHAPAAGPGGDAKVADRLRLNSRWAGTQTVRYPDGSTSFHAVTARVSLRDWKKFALDVEFDNGTQKRFAGIFEHSGQTVYARVKSIAPDDDDALDAAAMDSNAITTAGDSLQLVWTMPTREGERLMKLVLNPAAEESPDTEDSPAAGSLEQEMAETEPPDGPPNVREMKLIDDTPAGEGAAKTIPLKTKLTSDDYPALVRKDLIRVLKAYRESCAKHRKTLLGDFGKQEKRLRAQKPQQLAAIETLQTERRRFETSGFLPLSAAMRQDAFEYVDRIYKDFDLLRIGFNSAISKLLREKKDAEAKLVEQDLAHHTLLFGRWRCEFNNSGKKERFLVELYSDGTAKDVEPTQGVTTRRWEKQVHPQLGIFISVIHAVDPLAMNRFTTSYNQPAVGTRAMRVAWKLSDDGESFEAFSNWTQREYTGSLP